MAGKTLSYFNLTGGLNTVQTMATINSTPNRTESPDMVNVEYFKLSGLRTMNGNVGLNKVGGVTTKLNPSANTVSDRINFGYEYIKGNQRYMIVADRKNLYEYNPTNDTFNLLIGWDNAGDGTTMCGYANGVVAASPHNNYLIYYQKNRLDLSLGSVTTTQGNSVISLTSTYIEDLGKGDLIEINGTEYEIDEVNIDDNEVTLTEAVAESYSGDKIYLTDFTKIYCTYVSIVQDGNDTQTTTTNFTPKVVQSHQGRLWVGAIKEGDSTAAYVLYSDLGNIHNAFEGGDASAYDAGYFAEFWEDTSDITAIGTWDKYVVVHKREHTYLINTSNSDATEWNVESYSDYTCDNQQGFVKANNGYYTYCSTAGGIYPMIQRTIYSAISQGADASIKIRDSFLNLNTYALDEIYAVYHPYKKYIMFYMPMIGEGSSNNCYILDLQTKTWLHRRIPQSVCTAFEFNSKIYIGTSDGKIYEEFRGLDFDGEPIKFSWKSPWFIWGNGTNWTTTREIRIKMSQEGTNNFYIRNRRDGNEDYKQRTITNTSDKVNSLLWDRGHLTDDKDGDYVESAPIYSYVFHEGEDDEKTYYSLDSILNNYSLMFQNEPSKITLIGGIPNGALWYRDECTESDPYDTIEAGTDTAYAFKYTPMQSQYMCYQSTKDSNIKAWVTRGITNKAVVNVKDTKDKYLVFKCNYFTVGFINQYTRPYYYSVLEEEYNKIKDKANSTCKAKFGGEDGTKWYDKDSEGLMEFVLHVGNPPSGTSDINNLNRGKTFYWYNTKEKMYQMASYPAVRVSSKDYSSGDTKEVWNGKSTRSGKTKTVSYYSSSYITIDGVRFNRYTAGDEGSIEDTSQSPDIVYGKTQILIKGQTVYTDKLFDNVKGKVSAVSGTNYTIDGRVYVPSEADNEYGLGTKWFITKQMFANGSIGTATGNSATAFYTYSLADFYNDDTKLLTDSKWDGNEEFEVGGKTYEASYTRNAQGVIINDPPDSTPPDTQSTWVNTGQVTKRFPIDRQYFQTLQLEFCGETSEQGIELYGFEVDGIQLTEVPY